MLRFVIGDEVLSKALATIIHERRHRIIQQCNILNTIQQHMTIKQATEAKVTLSKRNKKSTNRHGGTEWYNNATLNTIQQHMTIEQATEAKVTLSKRNKKSTNRRGGHRGRTNNRGSRGGHSSNDPWTWQSSNRKCKHLCNNYNNNESHYPHKTIAHSAVLKLP